MNAPVLPRIRLPRLRSGAPMAVVVVVLGLVAALAVEPTRQLIAQRERIGGMESDLEQLERANKMLEARIERLQDPDFVEQRAREQIGLVRPGETAYVVMPPAKRKHRAPQRAARPQAPPEPSFVEALIAFIGF